MATLGNADLGRRYGSVDRLLVRSNTNPLGPAQTVRVIRNAHLWSGHRVAVHRAFRIQRRHVAWSNILQRIRLDVRDVGVYVPRRNHQRPTLFRLGGGTFQQLPRTLAHQELAGIFWRRRGTHCRVHSRRPRSYCGVGNQTNRRRDGIDHRSMHIHAPHDRHYARHSPRIPGLRDQERTH